MKSTIAIYPSATAFRLVFFSVLLLLLSPNLQAQSQPEAAENVLVFQKGEKEWEGYEGDYLVIKLKNRFRKYTGRISNITDSTFTLRRRTFNLVDLKKVTLGQRKLHRAAMGLAAVGLMGPYLVLGLVAIAEAIVGPPSILENNPTFWERFRRGTLITTTTALIASLVTNALGHKRFNLKRDSVKVDKRVPKRK